jgi:hypothetical protein
MRFAQYFAESGHRSMVFEPGDREGREVKNLGWLLRHWKEVESFNISEWTGAGEAGALMIAKLNDGGAFVTKWADASVLRDWLRRPVFRGAPLNWFGQKTKC